jgi:hypothetical protein
MSVRIVLSTVDRFTHPGGARRSTLTVGAGSVVLGAAAVAVALGGSDVGAGVDGAPQAVPASASATRTATARHLDRIIPPVYQICVHYRQLRRA